MGSVGPESRWGPAVSWVQCLFKAAITVHRGFSISRSSGKGSAFRHTQQLVGLNFSWMMDLGLSASCLWTMDLSILEAGLMRAGKVTESLLAK